VPGNIGEYEFHHRFAPNTKQQCYQKSEYREIRGWKLRGVVRRIGDMHCADV